MKEQKLHLTIYSPEKEFFDGEVKMVTLPGSLGSFNILPNHAPIVSTLKEGAVTYVLPDDTEKKLEILDGFIEMSYGNLSVCVTQ